MNWVRFGFCFVLRLHTQFGAQTHNPEIKT